MVFHEIGFKFFLILNFPEGRLQSIFHHKKQIDQQRFDKTLAQDFELWLCLRGTGNSDVLIRKDSGLMYYTFHRSNGPRVIT